MTVACYARKSNNRKNDSIENQFAIINDYLAKQQDLRNAEILEFSDEGISGLDMNRKAFQKLLDCIRRREIDVVIVKDLSRLGRNYLDVCKLTDSIFPFMNVRLISVSDNYDSKFAIKSSLNLPLAFKSVLNEFYALESSEKVKKSCEARIKNGEFIGRVSYGYYLADKFTICINEEKAAVVRRIFEMFLQGKSALQIAGLLNQDNIPSDKGGKWSNTVIMRILKNENYIGTRVALKEIKDPKTKRVTIKNKNECYVQENAFEPIISREVFKKTQERILLNSKNESRKVRHKKNPHIMVRKVYCAKCGLTLKHDMHFYCRYGYVTGEKPCFEGSLKRYVLYPAVLQKVKACLSAELERIQISFSEKKNLEERITCLKEKKALIYDSFFDRKISEKEFEIQNQAVSEQLKITQKALDECRKIISLNADCTSREHPIDTLKRLYSADELTKEHMMFVRRINVFDKNNFEIIMETDSPLEVLFKNINIFEEDLF